MRQTELPDIQGYLPARLVNWQPWNAPHNTLVGYATVAFDWATIHRIPVFRVDGGLNVGVPAMADIDAAGQARVRDGRRQYTKLLSFTSAADRDRYQRAVLAALDAAGVVA